MEHPIAKELREIADAIDRDSLILYKAGAFIELLSLGKIANPVEDAKTLIKELEGAESVKPVLKNKEE